MRNSIKEKETAAETSMYNTGFAFTSFDANSVNLRKSTVVPRE